MRFHQTEIGGVHRIVPEPRLDERGSFARVFCVDEFAAGGLATTVVQANTSFNRRRGTLRGLHLQTPPHGECKLVRCTRGAVFDVAVDARPGSPTFGRWVGVELSAQNGAMLFVPEGVAHGYLTLEDEAEVFYQVSRAYHPDSEAGVRWDDPAIGIRWPFAPAVISAKDRALPDLETLRGRLSDGTAAR